MDPMYRNMHSFPYQRDQIHYAPHFYPGSEPMPTQIHTNHNRPPVNYGCCPWGSNYGYAPPIACHGYCNHNNTYMPAHYPCGPSYSHHFPPPHCVGISYPSFPAQYMPTPSPCYPMEQPPRYEYEKNMPSGGRHCCGCSNHLNERRNVGIEEVEPDGERRKNDSLVPLQFKNAPYPIVWMPPEYGDKKEQGKDSNNIIPGLWKDGKNNAWYPLDLNSLVSSKHNGDEERKQHQQDDDGDGKGCFPFPVSIWKDGKNNEWYPLDLNSLVSSKHDGDEERKQHQRDEDGDGKGRFPFPLFWIPYKPQEKENEMEKHKLNDSDEKPSLASEKDPGGAKNFNVIGEDMGGQTAAFKAKDIPVKEVEKHEEKVSSTNRETEKDAHVKEHIDHGEKVDDGDSKLTKESAKGKSPSPKSSKLPPVCLRVDPLPRRKTSNGSSRSPSPPADKQRREASQVGSSRSPSPPDDKQKREASKVLNSSYDKKLDKGSSNEIKEGKGTKYIKVVDGNTKHMDVKSNDDFLTNEPEEKPKMKENNSRDITETDDVVKGQSEKVDFAHGKNEEMCRGKEGRADEAKEASKRKLSEEEAAVFIQSAYRGFETRRWEPVKKLKQIAKVREQIDDVKHMMQAMESTSDIQGSSKQRNVISETIMSLLLKLDTIQGLHPSVREVRKSVVKELVSLQEKLDAIMNEKSKTNEKSGNSTEQESSLRERDDALDKIEHIGIETPSDLSETDQNQPDGAINCGKSEISGAHLKGEESMGEVEKKNDGGVKTEDEKSNEVLEKDEISATKDDHHEDLVFEQSFELPVSCDSVKATDFAPPGRDERDSELAELPQGGFDDLDAQETTDQNTIGADTNKTCQVNHTVSEIHNDATVKENKENNQIHDVCGAESETVGIETGEDKSEHYQRIQQPPQDISDGTVEPFEASDNIESEFPTANKLKTNSGASDANGTLRPEQASDNHPLEQQDMIGVKNVAENTSGNNTTDSSKLEQAIHNPPWEQQDTIGVKNVAENTSKNDTTDYNTPEQAISNPPMEQQDMIGVKNVTQNKSRNETTNYNNDDVENSEDPKGEDDPRKLVEENERLRGIMEDLIKTGQEQLMAISSLTGRVKDLERKLSTKKRMKVKHRKGKRMRSLVVVPEDE